MGVASEFFTNFNPLNEVKKDVLILGGTLCSIEEVDDQPKLVM